MARLKIKDLPKDQKISKEELKRIRGGAAYIKFDGVDGESQDKDHKDWIDVLSFSQPTLVK
ncbi:MAG: type VI secretion system tube protein Hcp [Deltaproteobacteria bacterium]|nr:type VI secretion system tube protein Hcp [Deltaproteobacteria bacterium]